MGTTQYLILEKLNQLLSVGALPTLWTLCLLFAVTSLYAFVFSRSNDKRKLKKRIPGPKVHPIITTLIPLISIFRNKQVSNRALFLEVVCGYTQVFRKEGMWLFYGGVKPILILSKAETVEPVLNSNEILQKGFEYDLLSPWLKEGLLTSKGKKWRLRRKLLTPAFHFRILDEFIPVFNEQSRIFAQKIEELMKGKEWIDIAPLTSYCTLDIICETAMGKRINAQENSSSPYVLSLHLLCRAAAERLLCPWLWPDFIYYRTKMGKCFRKCLDVMDKFTRQVVQERKQEKLKRLANRDADDCNSSDDDGIGFKVRRRLALLDLLLDLHLKDDSFTLEDIAEEVDNFMFAGHDTTSSGLSWALYMIGLHQDIQRKAQEELDEVFGDDLERPVTLDDIKKLKYLDCVLKETRRLFPPTPFIARDLPEDTDINGYTIPKGYSCGILIYMLHRDPDVFPHPEVFDPERFRLQNTVKRHPFAYVPFSAGPRNCIGQRFATFEAITVLATLLRHFNITSMDHLDRLHIVDDIVLRSEFGLRLKFTRRKSCP